MEILDRPNFTEQFFIDRRDAMLHINEIFDQFNSALDNKREGFLWIKTALSYPSFDDFTFAYRNKIFSVIVERAERTENNKFAFGNAQRVFTLLRECKNNNLVPCVYPVIENKDGSRIFYGRPIMNCRNGKHVPSSWNLIRADSKTFVDPISEASDELIEVSDWELQNWSVQIVSDYLYKEGFKRLSYCDMLGIEPHIWFENSNGARCWIEVLYAKYPDTDKTFSFTNWPYEVLKYDGYKAVVSFANINIDKPYEKLYRAQGADVNFRGITLVHSGN